MTIELTNASNIEYPAEAIMKAIDEAIIAKAIERGLDHITAEIIEVAGNEATVDLYQRFEGCFETIKVIA